MATFNDLVQTFKSILNRDDCPDQLAASFIAQAIQRSQRSLRIPSMERSRLILAQGLMTYVTVPDDLLEVIDVFVSANSESPAKALEKFSFRQISGIPTAAAPSCYARLGNLIQIRGGVPAGGQVMLHYYGSVADFTTPDSENELSIACPDVVVYGALKFAGDWCDHPNADDWDQTYQTLLSDVQASAVELENTGGPSAIQPLYRWE